MLFQKILQLQIFRKFNVLSSSIRINDLLNESEPIRDIVIQGWVRHAQRFGKMLFLKLNDGTCHHQLQAVVPRTICHTVHVGSALRLRGHWVPSIGKQQQMEFLAEQCLFVNESSEFVGEGKDKDALRLIPHLRPKTLEFAAILRMRSRLNFLIHKFFNDRHFIHIDTPMFSQNDCEGAGEAFSATCSGENFFGDIQKPFLPVSAQLHLEAMSSSLGNVYTISPIFRANPSQTRQHLAEFKMLEVECAFMDSFEQLCTNVEEFLCFIISSTEPSLQIGDFEASSPFCQRNAELASSKILAECLIKKPFPRISFTEASKLLGRKPEEDTKQLSKKDELDLVDAFGGPVFVTHFLADQKPFYMRRTEDGKYTESFDLLAPFVGELAGGSVREWDKELLASRLSLQKDGGKLEWYMDLRCYGYPRSAGFGIGVDRLMQSLFGSDIYRSILDQVGQLHGDYGAGAICGSLQVKVRDPSTNTAVIRINSKERSFVSTALPFILKIGKCRCTLQLLFEGSSIRTVERFLLRSNLKMLYTKLRIAKCEEEKSSLRSAIRSITGPRIAHIRM